MLWFVQHVVGRALRLVVIAGAVILGLKVMYVDGGATYGASPFFDGIALFVWGYGAEVSSRGLASLGAKREAAPQPLADPKLNPQEA
jgi:hypothetical protein